MPEIKLETKRLVLRRPKKSDWKDILDGAGEYDVAKMTKNIPHPYKKKDAEWFIKRTAGEWRKKKKTGMTFLLELKKEKKVIGAIGLHNISRISAVATTGSWVSKKYWRQGYITEAKIAVNDFAFNKLKLRRLNSIVIKENKASNGTQKKVGYKHEGLLRKAIRSKSTGKIHDVNFYGLLKEDWRKARPRLIADINKRFK